MSNHTPPPIISTSSASGSKPSLIDPGTAEPRGAFCPPDRDHIIALLRDLDACDEALAWIEQTPGEPKDLWAACQHGDWMIWLLATVGYDKRTMRHIACDCAEGVLYIYERAHPDDSRPRNAIAVARRYADGKATDDELAAAYYAASTAARNAAWDAAWAAARTATQDATCDVARDAAWDATWAAARDAARAASQNAARDAAQNAAGAVARAQTLDAARDPVWTIARDAAWDAAWDAARDAAWDAAWDAAMARHADIVRARVSWADVERAMRRAAADWGEGAGDGGA